MNEYIVNFTDGLINSKNFSETAKFLKDRKKFIEHVSIELSSGEISKQKMRSDTVGRIMGSFEPNDVQTVKEEIFQNVFFMNDCDEFQRDVLSVFLACVIWERLAETRHPSIPGWVPPKRHAKK